MGYLLWIQHLIGILPEFLQSFMQYLTILDRVLTALDYILSTNSKKTGIGLVNIVHLSWLLMT